MSAYAKRARRGASYKVGKKKLRKMKRSARAIAQRPIERYPLRPAGRGYTQKNCVTKGFVGMEKKFIDLEYPQTVLTTGPAMADPAAPLSCLNAIAVGDGASDRDGRVSWVKSLHIRALLEVPRKEGHTIPPGDVQIRLAVVWDMQTNQAACVGADIFDAASGGQVAKFRELDHSSRFRMLYDKTFLMRMGATNEGAVNLFATGGRRKYVEINHTFKEPIKVIHSSDAAEIAGITDNSFHVVAWYHGGTIVPKLQYHSRVRFY